MMKRRILALSLSVALLATVLCACGDGTKKASAGSDETSSSGEIVNGGEIVVGIAQDLGDSLDPYHMTAAGTREVFFNVYEGLIRPNSDGDYVSAVASDYKISENGLTYTFTLREGVLFHDGDKVTVEDVIKSFETCAATTVDASLAAALSNVQSVKATDNKTITITLKEASADFLSYASMVYIVPAGYKDQATAPVGTGPFKFVSRAVQENIVLEKFVGYWGQGAYLDKVTYKIFEDANALMNALNAGSIDLVAHLSSDQVDSLGSSDYQVLEGTMNLVQALYLNNAVKPFDNAKVRQALCYAVDVDEILKLTSNGHGVKVGSSMYPAFTKYFDESLSSYYTYNQEKAKELLKEAGYPNGFAMTITVPSNYTPHVNTAEVIAEQLARVGIKATINPVEWDTWLSEVYANRKFESTVIGFDATTLTAGAMLERWIGNNDRNMINFKNADYDSIMAKANITTDDKEQTALYKQAERILTEQAANVYIQDMADFVVIKKGLGGYQFYPLYVMDMAAIHYVQ